MRVYSPVRTILAPSRILRSLEARIIGGPGAVLVFLAELLEHARDVVADMAEIAAFDVHRQVNRRLQVDVVNFRGQLRLDDRRHVPQRDRLALAWCW